MNALASLSRSWRALRRELEMIRTLPITPTDLVLDLGSGQNPNLRANVLCDKFVFDHSERACQGEVYLDGRPFVIGDALCLPFRDRVFDFVICSHVIEHVPQPDRLLQELQRVAKAGYLEAPSRLYEKLFGLAMHKWYVHVDDGVLHLDPKSAAHFDEELNRSLQGWMQTNPAFERVLLDQLHALDLLVQFHWSDQIPYVITPASPPSSTNGFQYAQLAEDMGHDHQVDGPNFSWRRRVKRRIGRHLRRASDERLPLLEALLACPDCHGEILKRERAGCSMWECLGCGRTFSEWNGCPVLLPSRNTVVTGRPR